MDKCSKDAHQQTDVFLCLVSSSDTFAGIGFQQANHSHARSWVFVLAGHNLLSILRTRFGQPRFLFPSEVFFWIAQRVPTLADLEDQHAEVLFSMFGYQMMSNICH